MTPIKSVSKTETKNFGQVSVNEFWLEIPASASSGSQDKKYLDHLKNVLDSVKDGVICVFSEELSSKPLCEALANARDNGSRIYILTNNYHGEMKNLEGCLIRYGGNKRLGSFILINPNSDGPSGCLFTGPLSDESINLPANLLLDLDNAQVSTFFRYFCYQFWNKAGKERIGTVERDVGAAPLDIYPPIDDSCDFQYLKAAWDKKTNEALLTTSLLNENNYLKFSNFSNSKILSLFSEIDNNMVRSLKQNNNEIYACDAALINSLKLPDGTWLITKTDSAQEEEIYSIKLNPEQAKVLNDYIKALSQERTKYRYFTNRTREELKDKTIFYLGDLVSQKFTINTEKRITVSPAPPSELLPKEEFENLKPAFTDDGRTVLITYEWTNIPFTLPSRNEHPRYKEWENAEKSIVKYIDDILNVISENEKREGKILGRIKHFFLGKQQKFFEYRKELENLKIIKYSSVEKTELEKRIKRIIEICKLVDKDSSEIDEENRKAEIEEKIEYKQKEIKKCEGERDEKEKELQEKQKDIETKSASQEVLQKELNGLNSEKKLIETEITSLQAKIRNITDNENKAFSGLADKKKNLQKKEEAITTQSDKLKEGLATEIDLSEAEIRQNAENERKPLEDDLASKQNILREKETVINSKVAYLKEVKEQSDNLKIAKNKITNERNDKNDKIKRFNNEIKTLEGQLKNPVIEKQNEKSSLRNLKGDEKTPNQSGQVKELADSEFLQFLRLPHTGELFQHNGQDYLAITDWEDYDKGKAEAKRLNAKLCAKGENNG